MLQHLNNVFVFLVFVEVAIICRTLNEAKEFRMTENPSLLVLTTKARNNEASLGEERSSDQNPINCSQTTHSKALQTVSLETGYDSVAVETSRRPQPDAVRSCRNMKNDGHLLESGAADLSSSYSDDEKDDENGDENDDDDDEDERNNDKNEKKTETQWDQTRNSPPHHESDNSSSSSSSSSASSSSSSSASSSSTWDEDLSSDYKYLNNGNYDEDYSQRVDESDESDDDEDDDDEDDDDDEEEDDDDEEEDTEGRESRNLKEELPRKSGEEGEYYNEQDDEEGEEEDDDETPVQVQNRPLILTNDRNNSAEDSNNITTTTELNYVDMNFDYDYDKPGENRAPDMSSEESNRNSPSDTSIEDAALQISRSIGNWTAKKATAGDKTASDRIQSHRYHVFSLAWLEDENFVSNFTIFVWIVAAFVFVVMATAFYRYRRYVTSLVDVIRCAYRRRDGIISHETVNGVHEESNNLLAHVQV